MMYTLGNFITLNQACQGILLFVPLAFQRPHRDIKLLHHMFNEIRQWKCIWITLTSNYSLNNKMQGSASNKLEQSLDTIWPEVYHSVFFCGLHFC